AKVIEELIQLAKDMRAANARGEALKLSEDEVAFYDALEANDSAVKVLGEPTLVAIARELVATVKKNVTIDWTMRENVRAQLRVIVKRILRKYGYPPDKQEKATHLVLEQAELLSAGWAAWGESCDGRDEARWYLSILRGSPVRHWRNISSFFASRRDAATVSMRSTERKSSITSDWRETSGAD